MKYKRILIKISGEALADKTKKGIAFDEVLRICSSIKECYDYGVEIALVVGGGNFWRGKYHDDMDRVNADHIGMLATTMNAIALQDGFSKIGVESRVQTAVEMRQIAEFYLKNTAVRHLEKNRITIFGCGTGNPFFSTDTGAALRAAEINADLIIKATKTDGVYDKDPNKFNDAKKFDEIAYIEVLNKKLEVMDATAISLCMETKIPIIVLNMYEKSSMLDAIKGKKVGTIIK
ncbi:MAG: UMP kinase [Bacilli bacterium]|nr:UMP kinase [Bacilli bacterium]